MILGSNHRHYRLAIYKGKQASLFAFHEFFDNNGATCVPKAIPPKHVFYSCIRFFDGHSHHNALTCGQAISFHHDRSTRLSDKFLCFIHIMEYTICCGRNVVFFHYILGKYLRPLQLGCCFRWTKHRNPRLIEHIC